MTAYTSGTVLVVDDDAHIQLMIKEVLEEAGYRVLQSVDGASLGVAVAEQPHLILLDVMMPHMDGVEVSQRLEQNPATAHIPVVAMSAVGNRAAYPRLLVDDWLAKPFALSDLYRIVVRWMPT